MIAPPEHDAQHVRTVVVGQRNRPGGVELLAVEIDARDTAAHMARVLDRDLVACGGVRAAAPPVAESEAPPVLRQARIDLQPLAVQVE